MTESTPSRERLQALDVLRGVALLGIFIVNLPFLAMSSDRALDADHSAVAAVIGLLAAGKIVSLFSMLFGMGLVLQMQRAEARGTSLTPSYLRRLVVLAVLGLLHGCFLFMGDILFAYAIAGLILYLCRGFAPAALLGAATLVFCSAALLFDGVEDGSTGGAPPSTVEWPAHQDLTFGQVLDASDEHFSSLEQKAFGDGPLATTLRVNVVAYGGWLTLATFGMPFHLRVLAWFFLGAAILKLGWHLANRRKLHRGAALIGIPMGIGAVVVGHDQQIASLVALGDTTLSLGYLGAVLWWAHSESLRFLQRALAAAGRMALTNYLGQSVAACVVFRWYGFDWFNQLNHGELLGVTFAVFAVQVA